MLCIHKRGRGTRTTPPSNLLIAMASASMVSMSTAPTQGHHGSTETCHGRDASSCL